MDASLTGPAPDAALTSERAGAAGRAWLEVLDRDGQVRQSWPVEAWPLRIGRALDNDLVLTDPHVAAHHLEIDASAASVVLTAGATRNGIAAGTHRLNAGQSLTLADSDADLALVVGRTRLRLRLPGHALAPEQLMSLMAAREQRIAPTALAGTALLAAIAFSAWLESDPEGLSRVIGNALLTSLSGAAIWCGAWALISKTFTRQSHFGWHLRVFLIASLALLVLNVLPALIAFAFSWPAVSGYSYIALYAVGAVAVYFHLLAVEPSREKLMRWVTVTGALAAIALSLWFNIQRSGRAADEPYMNHLFPPAFRLAHAQPVEQLIDRLAPLQATLDRKAKDPASGEGEESQNKDDDDE